MSGLIVESPMSSSLAISCRFIPLIFLIVSWLLPLISDNLRALALWKWGRISPFSYSLFGLPTCLVTSTSSIIAASSEAKKSFLTDISSLLKKRLVNKETGVTYDQIRRALEAPEFQQYKDPKKVKGDAR